MQKEEDDLVVWIAVLLGGLIRTHSLSSTCAMVYGRSPLRIGIHAHY